MIYIPSNLTLLWTLFLVSPSCTSSFVTLSVGTKPSFGLSAGSAVVETLTAPPSWEELQEQLSVVEGGNDEEPLVTLYRDTNGWCPFCERVWLALRIKGVPYQETLISLQNKPEWYKQLVPTTLVPAVLFHSDKGNNDDDDLDEKVNERTLVWESNDILKALDEKFPDTPKLWVDENPEFEEALTMNTELTTAGIGYVYAGRNASLTENDIEERRVKFMKELDRLDAALAESTGGFRLGKDVTAIDCMMIPTLERWRHQLPITNEIDILEGRPNIKSWFETMDTFEPYCHRVMGDKYSWVAVSSTFLRYFSGDESDPKVAATIARADEAAEKLTDSFASYKFDEAEDKFVQEAANKLISNHEAIVKDCTYVEPLSQKHIDRASDGDVADQVLRYVATILVSDDNIIDLAKSSPIVQVENAKDGALAAKTVASRLCVPRDMSAPAAAVLRGVLSIVANRLEE